MPQKARFWIHSSDRTAIRIKLGHIPNVQGKSYCVYLYICISLYICIWVCLKIVYPYTQWLMIIIPIKLLFHWEYTLFSDKPISLYPFVSRRPVLLWTLCRQCTIDSIDRRRRVQRVLGLVRLVLALGHHNMTEDGDTIEINMMV